VPTEAGHAELLEALVRCRGTVVLSGPAAALYEGRLAGRDEVAVAMPVSAGSSGGRMSSGSDRSDDRRHLAPKASAGA
jgi:hypothetical protein